MLDQAHKRYLFNASIEWRFLDLLWKEIVPGRDCCWLRLHNSPKIYKIREFQSMLAHTNNYLLTISRKTEAEAYEIRISEQSENCTYFLQTIPTCPACKPEHPWSQKSGPSGWILHYMQQHKQDIVGTNVTGIARTSWAIPTKCRES